MSLLFIVEAKIVKPTVETLLIHPFSEIWERDTSSTKQHAIEDFAFIEFMTSVQKVNPYSGYSEDERRKHLMKDIISPTRTDWIEDDLIKMGMDKVIQFQKDASVTYNYYMSAKIAAEKMQNFFITFNIEAVNLKSGAPIYKPRDITSALNDTAKVLENLNTLRDKVDNELFEAVKNRGQKEVSVFADPSTTNDLKSNL